MILDRVIAVVAMLVSVRPLMRGVIGSDGHISSRRLALMVGGGFSAVVAAVGLLAVKSLLVEQAALDGAIAVPTWLGGALAFFGGMLGTSTLLSPRGEGGMSEDDAIRCATQAVSMWTYLAAPRLTLIALGLVRLSRGALPWTLTSARWTRLVEGGLLLVVAFIPRDPLLGGLVQHVTR